MKHFVLAMSLLASLCSCISINIGNGKSIHCKGPVVEKTMEGLTDFNAIEVNGSSDLFFTQANEFSVVVKANEEVFEHLKYSVEDGVLTIATKNNVNLRAEKYEVYVTLPVVKAITVNGAADVNQQGDYAAQEDLKVRVNGAGDLDFTSLAVPSLTCSLNGASDMRVSGLDVEKLDITINGAGDAVIAGKAASANFSVNGAGDIDARNLACESFSTHKAGAASIRVGSK